MIELVEYIKNNKVTKNSLKSKIIDDLGRKVPARNVIVLLRKYAREFFVHNTEPRMIALAGLRGVGKTTLAFQLANYVLDSGLCSEIYFLSGDELVRLNVSLYDAINSLEKVLKTSLNKLDRKIFLIIDEVHELKDWQKDLKILYDRSNKIFAIVTGSSAIHLHNSPDLATRWTKSKYFLFISLNLFIQNHGN